jgi:hypothetical protein
MTVMKKGQQMRKTKLFVLVGPLLAGVLCLADSPRAVARCPCLTQHNTPNFVGSGSSCFLADASVYDQADAYANNYCVIAPCNESTVIVTVPCSFDPNTGLYQETGHIHFGCLAC